MTGARFTSENARLMAQRSAEARRRKAEERQQMGDVIQLRDGRQVPRQNLPELASAVVHEMARKLLEGEIPIRTAADASKAAEVFHKVLRLEKGQATSIETMTAAERMGQVQQLVEAARARQSHVYGSTGTA